MRWAALICVMIPLSAGAAGKSRAWAVDDVLLNETASQIDVSPDGRYAVWVKTVMDEDKGEAVANLVRTDLRTQVDVPLTRGKDRCSAPQFSPDGKHIAFLSDRASPLKKEKSRRAGPRSRKDTEDDAKTQVWLLDVGGGEPWALTEFARDVQAFDWAGPGHVVFLAQEEKTRHENKIKEKKDTSNVVEDEAHEPPARLFRVDLTGKTIDRVTDNADRIEWFAVSPDGKRAVTHHQRTLRNAFDGRTPQTTELYDLETGAHERIFADKMFDLAAVRWRPDGDGFLAVNHSGNAIAGEGPFVAEVFEFTLKSKEVKKVDLGWDRGLAQQDMNGDAEGLIVTRDGFLALLTDGVTNKVAKFTRADGGWKKEMLTGDHVKHTFGLAASQDGKTVVYAHATSSEPAHWHVATIEGTSVKDAKAVVRLEDRYADKTFAKTEAIRWKGAKDDEVEGMLFYPHGYEAGKKYPAVVMIHGGPHYADADDWQDDWAYPANLFCQRGAFVFKPNYHGSSNYGLPFAASIADGKYYDLEVPDIEKGVDHLIAKGLVDADKLGVMGWSNGSILTIALTTSTTRYKAASAGAGDVDWVSDWGNCKFGEAFDRYYIGKNPLTDPKRFQDKSPFYKLDKVRTPTLIFFGENDRTVPAQQGWMHYRGLQQAGKTDVRFILFPGEEHGPKKLAHRRRKVTEELAWFDKHLFKTAAEKPEAIREESPLARLLESAKAPSDRGRYGLMSNSKLIPETVTHHGLSVGRFEVTQAQFGQFDAKAAAEPGRENYPAHGLTLDKAKAYCEWLTKLTGDAYRLPTEEEGEDLYGETDGENTLDYWAGYAVNPEDAKKLAEAMKGLPGPAPLLREVGRFGKTEDRPTPADLGGNVAEWVTTKDGGKLMGGSADQPADAKQRHRTPGEAYWGFRVVKVLQPKK